MNDPVERGARRLHEDAAEIKRSVKSFERTSGELADNADRRTVLAADRTLLAAERTYAAWVRTALAALAGGVGARALMKGVLPDWVGRITGSLLVIFAGFCFVAAVWRELNGVNKLTHPDMRPLPKGLLVPINFFLLLVAIAALVGIWSV